MGIHVSRAQLERLALGLGIANARHEPNASTLLKACLRAADEGGRARMEAALDRTLPAPPRVEQERQTPPRGKAGADPC